MTDSAETLASLVQKRFGAAIAECRVHAGEATAILPPTSLREVAVALRDEPGFEFEQLMDVCGVDYLDYGRADWETSEAATTGGFSRAVGRREYLGTRYEGPRFAAVYHLLSVSRNHRLRLRVPLEGDPPQVPSVIDVWSSANWFEREAFDLFGILFVGHPDLRRILTDYGFVGHPFRKDFPLIGNVEVRYDPERQRVVYEPVSIEPRTLVPKVIPHDHRYMVGSAQADPSQDEAADA